jgi:cold shock CspA family protein
MNINNSSEQVYYGTVTHFDSNKHYGFIEDETKNSYYFFVDTNDIIQKKKELKKQKDHKSVRTKFFNGDEVTFRIRSNDDRIEAYDVEFIRNVKLEFLVKDAEEKQILYGYLKKNGDKFYVKHIDTCIFIPIKISKDKLDLEAIYTQKINQLVPFSLHMRRKIEKLSAILVDRKHSDNYDK